MVCCRQPHEEYSATNATFTFLTLDENRNSINVRDIIRHDIDEDVKVLL